MENDERYVILCSTVQTTIEHLQKVLTDEFEVIHISSSDDLLNYSFENSLLILDQDFLTDNDLSKIVTAIHKNKLLAILYLDSDKSFDYSEILYTLDVSDVIIRHKQDHLLLVYSIKKAFNHSEYQKKTAQAIKQLKKELDATNEELEMLKGRLASRSESPGRAEILEEIIFVFKRGKIELPSHPKLSIKFKELMDKGASLHDIANLLRSDAAITSKLISISNSPYYRGMTNNSTLEQAIGRLGLNTTKQNVDAIMNRALYITKKKEFADIVEKLWEHSLSCAYTSQIVAQRIKLEPKGDDPFTLGLLHDIGKLVLLQTIAELQRTNKLGENIDNSELHSTLRSYHNKFGASLLRLWKFSPGFINVAAFHDNFSEANNISKRLIVVSFSNLLVKTLGYVLLEGQVLDLEGDKSTKLLKFTEKDISEISEEVNTLMDEFRGFFKE
jgi:HD-like signal output (HDOD) protein